MTRATGRQKAKAENTRTVLVEVARSCFGQSGYHATNTVDLVALAKVTRGALYHHFTDKRDLFEAVAWQVATELSQVACAAVIPLEETTWRKILVGMHTYLQLVASNSEIQRILLIDGPAVLGWQRWRELQSEVVLPGMVHSLNLLTAQNAIRIRTPEPLAHLLLAALNDAALAIAHAADPESARAEMSNAITELLQGLAPAPH